MANEWSYLVEEYLKDAGFRPIMYYVKLVGDSVEVDFDEQAAAFYVIDDVQKSAYCKEFIVDYKTNINTKRHTVIFYLRG